MIQSSAEVIEGGTRSTWLQLFHPPSNQPATKSLFPPLHPNHASCVSRSQLTPRRGLIAREWLSHPPLCGSFPASRAVWLYLSLINQLRSCCNPAVFSLSDSRSAPQDELTWRWGVAYDADIFRCFSQCVSSFCHSFCHFYQKKNLKRCHHPKLLLKPAFETRNMKCKWKNARERRCALSMCHEGGVCEVPGHL
jgi:hypothetical protein